MSNGTLATFQQLTASMSDLSSKLDSFSQAKQQESYQLLQKQGSSDAVRDIYNRKKQIAKIKETVKDPKQQQKQINTLLENRLKKDSTIYGKAYNNKASSVYANDIQVQAKQSIDQAVVESKGNAKLFMEMVKQYKEEFTAQAPSPELAIIGERSLTKYGTTAYRTIATREYQEQERQNKQSYSAVLQQQKDEYIRSDEAGRVEIGARIQASTQSAIENGYITEEQVSLQLAQLEKLAIAEDYKRGFKEANEQGKGKEYLQNFRKTKVEQFSYDEKRAIENQFQADLNRLARLKSSQEQVELARNEQKGQDATNILNKGEIPDNLLEVVGLKLSDKTKKQLTKAIKTQKHIVDFKAMNLTDVSNEVAKLEGKDQISPDDLIKIEAGNKYIAQTRQRAKQDPISLAIDNDIIDSEEIEPVTPDNLTNISKRIGYEGLVNQKFNVPMKLLTKDEADNITNSLNTGTFEDKMNILRNISSLPQKQSQLVFNQIGGKNAPTYSFVGRMLSYGNERAGQIALQGKGADIKLPADFKINLQSKIQGVFGIHTADKYNEFISGVTDYIKGLGLQGEDIENINLDNVLEQTAGKVTTINKKKTILPFGVSEDEFEDFVDNFTYPDDPELQEAIRDSVDMFGTNLQFHYKANGEYYIYNPDFDGENKYIFKDGKPFIVKWNN